MKKISLILAVIMLLTVALVSCGKCPEGSHTYVETVLREPTSDTPGLSSFTCSVCGDTYKMDRYAEDYVDPEDTTTVVTEPEETDEYTGNYDGQFKLKSEKHINANESLLTIIDPSYWDDDSWDVNEITVNDDILSINCTAHFGTNLRFILNDGQNADVAVTPEGQDGEEVKGQKYEDIGKAIFNGDVTSWEEHFSAANNEFEMTIEIPLSSEISNAKDLYMKFNIELPTTSGGWSIDTYYLRLSFYR